MALWPLSPGLAVAALVVLVGLPTLFATPGDKKQVVVPVRGFVTIALVLLQLVVAVVASWFAFGPVVGAIVTVLAVATSVTEVPRWRWLAAR